MDVTGWRRVAGTVGFDKDGFGFRAIVCMLGRISRISSLVRRYCCIEEPAWSFL